MGSRRVHHNAFQGIILTVIMAIGHLDNDVRIGHQSGETLGICTEGRKVRKVLLFG